LASESSSSRGSPHLHPLGGYHGEIDNRHHARVQVSRLPIQRNAPLCRTAMAGAMPRSLDTMRLLVVEPNNITSP
jgi:hypothetical protein